MEVLTNVTIREIIEKFGQGMREDRKLRQSKLEEHQVALSPKLPGYPH